jgi:HD-like signal output (HDOD) protein
MEVMAMVDDPVMSVAQLGKVIASHQELSERVLRIANSPIHALPARVQSLASAITLLGFNSLRDTVIRILVHGAMRTMVHTLIHYEEFWHHSISCGTAARILARRFCPERGDGAFVAGLFHDTGILLLAQGEAGDLTRLARLTNGATAGTPARHEAIGAWLATQWHLGDDIAEAIACHHTPGDATVAPRLAATVHVADVLCSRLQLGELPHDGGGDFAPEALEILGVDAQELSLENLADEAALIRSDLAAAPDFRALAESLKNALVEGIGALPEKQRLTFALHYLEGLSLGDIARVLRVSDADVQSLHAAAIDTLSGIIQDRI